jgi:hypothetical protein
MAFPKFPERIERILFDFFSAHWAKYVDANAGMDDIRRW